MGLKVVATMMPVVERYSTFMRDVRTYGFKTTAASGVATWKLKLSSRYKRTTSLSWES